GAGEHQHGTVASDDGGNLLRIQAVHILSAVPGNPFGELGMSGPAGCHILSCRRVDSAKDSLGACETDV
ncbi:MAG: hypothetical protein ABJA62_05755, partial [Luteimonas sp.]